MRIGVASWLQPHLPWKWQGLAAQLLPGIFEFMRGRYWWIQYWEYLVGSEGFKISTIWYNFPGDVPHFKDFIINP